MAKEVSQLVDAPLYYQAYLNYMTKQGVRWQVINTTGRTIDEMEALTNIAEAVSQEEEDTKKDRSLLDHLIDGGSHLRMGGIAFANLVHQNPNLRRSKAFNIGTDVKSFVESKGLIRLTERGYVWSNGEAPNILSEEFLRLVAEYQQVKLPN